jgi:hypothetical protein
VFAGMTLLFASHAAQAETPAGPPTGSVIERPAERPTGAPRLPAAPAHPAGTMV